MVAPILPHMAEDAFQSLPYKTGVESVFQRGWATSPGDWAAFPETDAQTWDAVLEVRDKANMAMEAARNAKLIGAGLEAKVRSVNRRSTNA